MNCQTNTACHYVIIFSIILLISYIIICYTNPIERFMPFHPVNKKKESIISLCHPKQEVKNEKELKLNLERPEINDLSSEERYRKNDYGTSIRTNFQYASLD